MAAVERQDDGSLIDEIGEADEAAALVGQNELRHRLAGLGSALAYIARREARDHAVDDRREFGAQPAHLVGNRREALAERRIHIPAAVGRLLEDFGESLLGHGFARSGGERRCRRLAVEMCRRHGAPICYRLVTDAPIFMPISSREQCSVSIAGSYRPRAGAATRAPGYHSGWLSNRAPHGIGVERRHCASMTHQSGQQRKRGPIGG